VHDAATSQPLEGAVVSLARATTTETVAYDLTNPSGMAVLVDLPAGDYVLSASIETRWTITEAITLKAGDHLAREVALHEAGTISGRVTGAGGAPLANVPLQALEQGGASALAFSDATGYYEFTELPRGTYAVSLWGGQYRREEVVINETTWQHTVNLALAGVSLSGRVVAADGVTPAGKATVLLLKNGEFVAAAPTDSTGGYRFVAVMPGIYSLMAGAHGGLTAPQEVTVAGGDATLPDLSLGTAGLAGSVRNAQGNLLAGATVTLLLPEESKSHLGQYFTAVPGADGAFQFAGLVAGTYVLNVHQPGYAIYRQEVTVSGPGKVQVDVTLGAGHAVSGHVRSALTGEVLVGARVAAYDTGTHKVMNSALSDKSGFYSIADVPNGTYDLIVSYDGHQQAEALNRVILDNSLTWDFDLLPQNTLLHGQVLDDALHPVAGALVAARNSRSEVVMYATADTAGLYRFDGLEAGTYTLQAHAYGFNSGEWAGVSLGNGQTMQVGLTATSSAMSTQPWLGSLVRAAQAEGQAVNGLLPSWFFGLVDYLTENNPEPTRIGDDNYGRPSIPAAECPEAEQAQRAAEDARAHKDSAYQRWDSDHKMYDSNVRNGLLIFSLQFADLMGTLYTLSLPTSVVNDAMSALPQSAGVLLAASSIGSSIYNLVTTYQWDFSSGPATISTLTGLFGDILAASYAGGMSIVELDAKLAPLVSESSKLGFGTIAAFCKAVSLISNTYTSWQEFMKAADSVTTSQQAYFDAYAEMMRRLRVLSAANEACCDPEQECCPNSECCDDDCCQGSDCEPPPPPPPDGGGGGSGGTNSVGSRDPNEKLSVGYGPQGWVAPDAELIYTIYFENVSTATAAAQQVFITDMLSPSLDWSSLELLSVGFNRVAVSVPPGLNHFETWSAVFTDPNPVRVWADLDIATGTLGYVIESVDKVTGSPPEDPLAGFQPPNDAEGSGEGYVSFKVRPVSGLASNATIQNRARIVFDVNPPIDTAMTLNTIDAGLPSSSVNPLPAQSAAVFTVSWTGSDAGSGVARYDVYVSEDGGAFVRWQTGITATQAAFVGRAGHTYGFYSVATDHVGHRQPAPTASQATTLVVTDAKRRYLPLMLRTSP
jgi:uncharacterized repeat protein (TIGR01451 family)